MGNVARNKVGDAMNVMTPNTIDAILVQGTYGVDTSDPLDGGIYRISVFLSVDDLGGWIEIGDDVEASQGAGMYMPHGIVEYVFIPKGHVVSAVDCNINLVPVV